MTAASENDEGPVRANGFSQGARSHSHSGPLRQAVGTSSRPTALMPMSDEERRPPLRRLALERELRLVRPARLPDDADLLLFVFMASS
jgi:hypothetical protein